MRRVRINFGSDFCGSPGCDICFKNAGEVDIRNQAKAEQPVSRYRVDTTVVQINLEDAVAKPKRYTCPKCNGGMVLRTNSYNGTQFYGCRAFPDCRGTRQLDGSTGYKKDPVPARAKAPTEPVKEVSFSDLLSRPAKLSDEAIETEGDLWKDSFISMEESDKEKSK